MGVSERDRCLLAAVAGGLPFVRRPFAAIGERCGMDEEEVIARLRRMLATGVIRRFGIVVRHRALGYRANAMVVFDVPDADVRQKALRLCDLPFVTLCYRRRRRPPLWPYNLFCMIHGRERGRVERLAEEAARFAGIAHLPRAALFSRRCFVQRGARYEPPLALPEAEVR
ncbi:hypothetical protein HRbin40_00401 [bacterium HR40]|nr:hypothetical protein HRbin40_00401 [bacterium HR40]